MTIDVERLGGTRPVTVIALTGELDASNYEQVIDVVRSAYADGSRCLVLDLEHLTFMASSGLFALHSAVRIMRGETPPDGSVATSSTSSRCSTRPGRAISAS